MNLAFENNREGDSEPLSRPTRREFLGRVGHRMSDVGGWTDAKPSAIQSLETSAEGHVGFPRFHLLHGPLSFKLPSLLRLSRMPTPPEILATGPELSVNASASPYLHKLSSRISVAKTDNPPDEIELADTPRDDSDKRSKVDTQSNASQPRANALLSKIQFASLCWSLFLAGWNDGTTGPLLPRIQEVYHVRPVVSFVHQAPHPMTDDLVPL